VLFYCAVLSKGINKTGQKMEQGQTKKRVLDDVDSAKQESKRLVRESALLGFVVLKQLVDIPAKVLEDLHRQSARAEVIFNGVDDGFEVKGDGKRKQFRLGRSKICESFTAALDKQIALITSHKRSPWVVIQSKAGCQEQPAHTDYEPQAELDVDQIPLALLLAVMPDTKLHVWPRSIGLSADVSRITGPIAKQTIELDPGDAVLFRGDLVHAGAAYSSDHLRMHCYLDSAAAKRSANTTWLIDSDNVDVRLRDAIKK
jgi:hypothetical protein